MPVNISRSLGFLDFVCDKLADSYHEVPNVLILIVLAGTTNDAYRVEVTKPEGRMVSFHPAPDQHKPFKVGEYRDKPNSGVLNLTAYEEIPPFIQKLIDEYMEQYPEYQLEVLLSEKGKTGSKAVDP